MPKLSAADFSHLKAAILENNTIDEAIYADFDVKRGLRNKDGSGVIAGLTRISSVIGARQIDGMVERVEGVLKYRGIDIFDVMSRYQDDTRYCFESVIFLLLVGRYPNAAEQEELTLFISQQRTLPKEILAHVIQGIPSKDVMNKLQTAVAALYAFDETADSNDPYENFLKAVSLTAKFPSIIAYSYLSAFKPGAKFVEPSSDMSLAEGFLTMLYEGKPPSKEEAHILDLCLVLPSGCLTSRSTSCAA